MSHKYSPILLYRYCFGRGRVGALPKISYLSICKAIPNENFKTQMGKIFQLLCAHIYIFEDGLKERNHWHLTQFLIYSQAIVFPVVICGCESSTIRKAECQRIDAFQLWCWRRLESPLNSKETKPINTKGHQP